MPSRPRVDRAVRRPPRPIARRARRLRRGDLKLLILDLLGQRSRHGYDIMRALQDEVPGFYKPSPGAVYPVLRGLAELGFVAATAHDRPRVFAITAEGRRFLREADPRLREIRSRLDPPADAEIRSAMRAVNHELRALNRSLEPVVHRLDVAGLQRVYDVLSRARRELDTVEPKRDDRRSERAPRPAGDVD